MSDNIKISFIPKKPIAQGQYLRRGRPVIGLAFTLAFLVVTLVVIVSGAELFYKYNRTEIKDNKLVELQDFNSYLENGPDSEAIEDIRIFQKRVAVVRDMLEGHIALNVLFDFIHNTTLSDVSFSTFDFEADITQEHVNVTLNGIAPSYEALAYYSLGIESESKFVKSIFIDSIKQDEDENVNFTIEINLDADALRYSELLEDEEMGGAVIELLDNPSSGSMSQEGDNPTE